MRWTNKPKKFKNDMSPRYETSDFSDMLQDTYRSMLAMIA